ncbi:MAG: glycosyltransferase family 2 protein [Paramuribaculum sp.]|nr:glycosyltransferase family 2 protein [Paramuribaculum sp.]
MLTIFTPTYNRGYSLSRLYNSLCNQSVTDFEWLIVDDGSTDDTESIINNYIEEAKITIIYKKKSNGGKHTAINEGVKLASGEWFFIVDSDDWLPSDSLSIVEKYIKFIQSDDKIGAVCGLRHISNSKILPSKHNFNSEIIDDFISFRAKFNLHIDMAEVFRTAILKKYEFPVYSDEKFLSEAVVWNRIAQEYQVLFFPEYIYNCKYLDDGLTISIARHHRNSPYGSMLYYNEIISNPKHSGISKIKAAINYWRYSIGVNRKKYLETKPHFISYLFFPVGYYFYLRDKKKK